MSPVSAAAAPDAQQANWPQFGYDEGHTAYNPLEKTIATSNVSKLTIGWNDQTIIQPSGIAYDTGVLFIDDMGQKKQGLYALDATTGKKKWYANVNLNGGWGGFRAVSAVAAGMVVTPCSNGSTTKFLTGVCGVNATTGKIEWKDYCTEYQGNPCPGLANGSDTSPSTDGKQIYVQITQGVNEQPDTLALNPKTGGTIWSIAGVYHCPDAGLGGEQPMPVAAGNVLAVLGCQGTSGGTEICALTTSSGAPTWCYQTQPYVQTTIADTTKFYVVLEGGSTSTIIAFNAKSGAQVWKTTVPAQNGSALAVDKTQLYVEDGGNGLYAFNASNGKKVWSYTANGNMIVGGAIAVANGIVYTNGGGGNNDNVAIAAFNAKTGKLIYSTSTVSNGSSPAFGIVANGSVYTGCYTMCAFTLSSKK
ncbi:MAG TPA: PQQ-binding-like beta-propeller repeat protein [Candidatus Tumulicola sp.]